MMFFTPGSRGFWALLVRPVTTAPRSTSTAVTPGSLPTAAWIDFVIASREGQAGVVRLMPTRTRPPLTLTSRTMPAETKSICNAGSFTCARTARTSSTVGMELSLRGLGNGAQLRGGVGVVTHLAALDREVALAVRVLAHPVRDPLDHLDPLLLQALHLEGVVGHEPDRLDVQVVQDGGGQIVAARVRLEAQLLVGLDGVGAVVLQIVGADL